MSNRESVAIFWDYGQWKFTKHWYSFIALPSGITENCRPPSGSCGYNVLDSVRHVANQFGAVTVFRAYLELGQEYSKTKILRSELQSSGVSLIDCPHNGQKDVADKMILGV
jgi:hypothetical protein